MSVPQTGWTIRLAVLTLEDTLAPVFAQKNPEARPVPGVVNAVSRKPRADLLIYSSGHAQS